MKTIVLDHLRRWWWLWSLSSIACVWVVGFGSPLKPDLSNAWFPLAMYLGVVQLSQDLNRTDFLRVLRSMPVSDRELGRAWWWASVGVPVVLMSLLVGLVFVASPYYAKQPLSPEAAINFLAGNALLFGPQFFFLSQIPGVGNFKNWRAQLLGIFFSLLFIGTTFSMIYFYRIFPPHTLAWKCFLAVGLLLSLAGWFSAEGFARNRLESPVRRRVCSGQARRRWLQSNKPAERNMKGPGGMGFLFQTILVRMVLMGLTMMVIGGGAFRVTQWLTNALSSMKIQADLQVLIFLTQMLFWLILWQTMKASLHVRVLRTLPVPAASVAGTLIFAPLAAMLTVSVFATLVFAFLFSNLSYNPMELWRHGSLLQMSLAIVVVPIVVWRGFDLFAAALVMVMVIGGPVSALMMKQNLQLDLLTHVLVASGLIAAAFLATTWLLTHSGTTYRPRKNQFGGRHFGAGQ